MRFSGLKALPVHEPVVEVTVGKNTYDLHNDARLEQIEIHRDVREVLLRWKANGASWRGEGARVLAGISIRCAGVRECTVSGGLISEPQAARVDLDFIEYAEENNGHGRLRFVMDNGSELSVVADTCELTEITVQT
jgi:hypothetical protein